LEQFGANLTAPAVVLVGEHHAERAHHAAQLSVIRALNAAGHKVAIGLEMFRRQAQPELDRWVAGELDQKQFEAVFAANWGFDPSLYQPIFDYAREASLPLIALNIAPAITRQVAREGFASLSSDQRGELSGITCQVSPEYREFIKQAHGAHAHGGMDFEHFCEAQLVWDQVMALNALAYLKQHPDTIVVLLAGVGHARKPGIPIQILQRSEVPVTVILPEVPGRIEPSAVTVAEADFIFLLQKAK
jgi:uncharacterized iron-regulated protein